MRAASSRIFENYVKIAKEKNLLSEKKEKEEKTNIEKYDPSDLEMLYGLKLDPGILGRAHPETSVLFQSHDKFNGVVENLEECQQKMLDIVNRTPRPTLTQQNYISATENLEQTLLKLAWKLEQENKTELTIFADSCLEQLKKEALAPLAIAGIAAAIIIPLYSGLSQKYQFNQGIKNDSQSFLIEVKEAIEETPQLKNDLDVLIQQVELLKAAAEEVTKIEFVFKPSKDQEKLTEETLQAVRSKEDQKAIIKLTGFKNACQELIKIIPDYISILEMKKEQYQSQTSSFLEPFRRLYRMVVPSNLEDVIIELQKLLTSVSAAPKQIDAQIRLFQKMRSTAHSIEKFKQTLQPEEEKKEQKLDLGNESKPVEKKLLQLDLT